MEKHKFLFKVYYIGKSKYYGSQRQHEFLTIEECILNALLEKGYVTNIEDSGFEAASRTDRYVSARSAFFTCILKKEPILMEINSSLPFEIGVWASTQVPLNFLSRFNAIQRHYLYILPTPFSTLQKTTPLNIDIMHEACRQLEGRHDFINFSKKDKEAKTTVRDMDYARFSIKQDFLIFQFKSRAFLRQQVRRMVAMILGLGKCEIDYEHFIDLFDPKKTFSYQPADPKGLVLWDIIYGNDIKLKADQKSEERMKNYFLKEETLFSFKHKLFSILQHDDFS
ncbi:MAG: tRNA pseudouridine(38-40) synthase TruA [Promethearchaeota archaeon]